MRRPVVHIVGAGLAGLAATLRLSQAPCELILHEASRQAGGRCRSFYDSAIDMTIDNGAHLLLSGNTSALAYLKEIGSADELSGAPRCEIAFVDMSSGERWTIRPSDGSLPWWLLSRKRNVPGVRLVDHWPLLRLMRAPPGATVEMFAPGTSRLSERIVRPFVLATCNSEPKGASAKLVGAELRETFALGAQASRPLAPVSGLSRAFVDPALKVLRQRGAQIRFERRLTALAFDAERVVALDFEHDSIALAPEDMLILATPAHAAQALLPGLKAPDAFNAILNAHFRIAPPERAPKVLGVINGSIHWLTAYPDRLSATICDAGRYMDRPREEVAAEIWREVAALTGLSDSMPSWRIIRERRATFAATPAQDALRPASETATPNLLLAGDYVQTGLPASIEGAIRSGEAAAQAARKRLSA
jgi:squalene-associated FAD-dependent desaturase